MSYLNSVNPHREVDLSTALAHVRKNIEPLLPTDKKVRIVELGCGTGRYVSILRSLGYQNTYGCDSDEDSVRFASETFGLKDAVICKDLMSYLNESRPDFCDVVLLIDVIEHLPQEIALEMLRKLACSLVDTVIIQTPNAFSVFQPTYWGDWTHKHLYSKASLKQLLTLSGFAYTGFKGVPIRIHGLVSLLRALIWNGIINPAILAFNYAAYGSDNGRIFTANLMCVARKDSKVQIR